MFHQSQTISYLVPVFQGNLTTAFPVCHAIWLCSVGAKKQSEHGNMIVDRSTSTHRRLHYCATWLLISYNSTYYQLVFIGLEVCTGSREAIGMCFGEMAKKVASILDPLWWVEDPQLLVVGAKVVEVDWDSGQVMCAQAGVEIIREGNTSNVQLQPPVFESNPLTTPNNLSSSSDSVGERQTFRSFQEVKSCNIKFYSSDWWSTLFRISCFKLISSKFQDREEGGRKIIL